MALHQDEVDATSHPGRIFVSGVLKGSKSEDPGQPEPLVCWSFGDCQVQAACGCLTSGEPYGYDGTNTTFSVVEGLWPRLPVLTGNLECSSEHFQ